MNDFLIFDNDELDELNNYGEFVDELSQTEVDILNKYISTSKLHAKFKTNSSVSKILADISGVVQYNDDEIKKYMERHKDDPTDKSDKIGNAHIPIGIFYENNIPIKNIRIIGNQNMINYDTREAVKTLNVTDIHIFDEAIVSLKELLEAAKQTILIGAIVWRGYMKNFMFEKFLIPIIYDVKSECVRVYYHVDIKTNGTFNNEEYKVNEILTILPSEMNALVEWYGIQTAYLNPLVKYSIVTSKEDLDSDIPKHKSNNNKKKKPIRYVKNIRIKTDEIENIIYKKDAETGEYHRKTLIWYVAGHWVTRNGKTFFRHGHWKGPLRNTKMFEEAEIREREIVTEI